MSGRRTTTTMGGRTVMGGRTAMGGRRSPMGGRRMTIGVRRAIGSGRKWNKSNTRPVHCGINGSKTTRVAMVNRRICCKFSE